MDGWSEEDLFPSDEDDTREPISEREYYKLIASGARRPPKGYVLQTSDLTSSESDKEPPQKRPVRKCPAKSKRENFKGTVSPICARVGYFRIHAPNWTNQNKDREFVTTSLSRTRFAVR